MATKLDIKTGQLFGMLTIIKELDAIRLPSGQINRIFLCMCDCGNETSVRLSHLVHGKTKSCGCVKKTADGGCYDGGIYNVWRGMKNRCKPNYFQKHLYYDKGITVCKEWLMSYARFKMWALDNGYMQGLQIDREDNSLGYYPGNCRFVTQFVNINNRDNSLFVTYKGVRQSLIMLLRELDKIDHYAAIRTRISRGWDHDKAINTQIRKGNYFKKYHITNETI